MKKKQTASEKYAENMKKQGFSKKAVWIPDEDTEKLHRYAERMRNVYKRKMQQP